MLNSHPFAAFWGDGTTSSSVGQYFRAGDRGEAVGQTNSNYGGDPGVLFYTHLSDQYAPFHTQVINAHSSRRIYVLDGLLTTSPITGGRSSLSGSKAFTERSGAREKATDIWE
jgi:TnpA family transposase